jgi:hypothetical protein
MSKASESFDGDEASFVSYGDGSGGERLPGYGFLQDGKGGGEDVLLLKGFEQP